MKGNPGLGTPPPGDLQPYRAILILAFLIASIIYGIAACRPIPYLQENKPNGEDLKYYQAVVDKIHQGGSYYSAAGYELRHRGFATASIFNWRLPLLAFFLGNLPSPLIGQAILFVLAATSLFLWLKSFQRRSFNSAQIVFGGLSLSGLLIYSLIPGPFLMHEFWAGSLIVLSLAIYAHGWGYTSALAGLTALFLRELALPFVFVMLILAYFEGKRREALLWFLGIIIFSVEFYIHWSMVSRLLTESDKILKSGWIAFGGWPFILNTAQMHPFLILAPTWIAAIIVPLSMLGLIGRRYQPWEIRIACTIGVYMLFFGIVGQLFNAYWGLMYAFLVPLGLLHAPRVLNELWSSVRGQSHFHNH